jgi:hypothetical protein
LWGAARSRWGRATFPAAWWTAPRGASLKARHTPSQGRGGGGGGGAHAGRPRGAQPRARGSAQLPHPPPPLERRTSYFRSSRASSAARGHWQGGVTPSSRWGGGGTSCLSNFKFHCQWHYKLNFKVEVLHRLALPPHGRMGATPRHFVAVALGLLFSLLSTPVRAYNFYTYPDWASCMQNRSGSVVSGVCNACTSLSPVAGSIKVVGRFGTRVQWWASVNCSGSCSEPEVQVSSPCTPFLKNPKLYARLLEEAPCSSPSPAPGPPPSPAPGFKPSFYFPISLILFIPAVIVLIGVRCFCCTLSRTVTGLPVRSWRHRHDLRFTVSADVWGDCLASVNNNASNSSGNSSSVYPYASRQQPQFTCVRCPQRGSRPRSTPDSHSLALLLHLAGSWTCAAPRAGSRRGSRTRAASATTLSARGASKRWVGARLSPLPPPRRPAPSPPRYRAPLRRPAPPQAPLRPCWTA